LRLPSWRRPTVLEGLTHHPKVGKHRMRFLNLFLPRMWPKHHNANRVEATILPVSAHRSIASRIQCGQAEKSALLLFFANYRTAMENTMRRVWFALVRLVVVLP